MRAVRKTFICAGTVRDLNTAKNIEAMKVEGFRAKTLLQDLQCYENKKL